jgi:hypothetical protein
LGYHGCDRDVGMKALLGDLSLVKSDAPHDWLGHGIYFWESDQDRAMEWAIYKKSVKLCNEPFVIGAIIDLGNCFDLTVRANLDFLGTVYESYAALQAKAGLPLPVNKDSPRGASQNKVMRHLDCAVMNHLHQIMEDGKQPAFDTIRGLFVEGERAYPGSEVYKLTHVQIAVCNENSIRGVFLPRD